ncbi:MAG: succinate dehydrogenase/fumarate reductase iron-sulfur subunit [Gammaproteobacteria bacterium]|nr:succinate dehydrogenase/fumarate reductase iron-sulfur subunit [Gammaproteobacteria bacterium]
MNLTLHVWRQADSDARGDFETFKISDVSPDMSFLEMLDVLNEGLISEGSEPVAFDHDCREGICGACSLVINGVPHGPQKATTTCQLYMREFDDGQAVWIEPWRVGAFPVVRDLVVDRSAFDRILQAGGYVSVRTGAAPDGNTLPVPKDVADRAFTSATCIGCGACAAACPSSSASLFVAAKISHLGLLPQGQVERNSRVRMMLAQMDGEGFGHCSNHAECQSACPKEIDIGRIARMNRDLYRSFVRRT